MHMRPFSNANLSIVARFAICVVFVYLRAIEIFGDVELFLACGGATIVDGFLTDERVSKKDEQLEEFIWKRMRWLKALRIIHATLIWGCVVLIWTKTSWAIVFQAASFFEIVYFITLPHIRQEVGERYRKSKIL